MVSISKEITVLQHVHSGEFLDLQHTECSKPVCDNALYTVEVLTEDSKRFSPQNSLNVFLYSSWYVLDKFFII